VVRGRITLSKNHLFWSAVCIETGSMAKGRVRFRALSFFLSYPDTFSRRFDIVFRSLIRPSICSDARSPKIGQTSVRTCCPLRPHLPPPTPFTAHHCLKAFSVCTEVSRMPKIRIVRPSTYPSSSELSVVSCHFLNFFVPQAMNRRP
jgi:hypothetical protein